MATSSENLEIEGPKETLDVEEKIQKTAEKVQKDVIARALEQVTRIRFVRLAVNAL